MTFNPHDEEAIRDAGLTLIAAARKARENDDLLLADVFHQWAFVCQFGDTINRIGGPETYRLAVAYLAGPAPWKPVDINQKD